MSNEDEEKWFRLKNSINNLIESVSHKLVTDMIFMNEYVTKDVSKEHEWTRIYFCTLHEKVIQGKASNEWMNEWNLKLK